MKKVKLKDPQIVVHLGNVGTPSQHLIYPDFKEFEKTREYAQRFPNTSFVGIDSIPRASDLPNLRQVNANFIDGLATLNNDSIHLISSELAAGHYNNANTGLTTVEDSLQLFNLAHKKLRKGGKMILVVSFETLEKVKQALIKSKFRNEFTATPLNRKEMELTFSMRRYLNLSERLQKKWGGILHRIIATKKA